jgi:membrane protease YdiL (CAAX protease family)
MYMENTRYRRLRIVGRILVAVLLGFVVLNIIATVVMKSDFLPTAILSQPWAEGALSHTTMWLVSLILILIISKGKLSTFGFRLGKNYLWTPMIALGVLTGVVFTIILNVLPETSKSFLPDYSFAQTVIFVWLYASICEEILTRGLVQGFLSPLTMYGISISGLRFSLPVLVGAFFFGLMHLGLLTLGAGLLQVMIIVAFATVLGVIAGYYREQTGSLIPAIIVHMFGNIGGYCMGLFWG